MKEKEESHWRGSRLHKGDDRFETEDFEDKRRKTEGGEREQEGRQRSNGGIKDTEGCRVRVEERRCRCV